ncbi:MAG: helix-turn-helix transcriptional regulator [Clostridia bacterium]|nr:helix-turn-helix transcriptional regulator [Clostridia bacterium]
MVILSKFAENLSALMMEHELNAPALAKLLDTDRTNITRYLRAERLPSYNVFVKLIEFFNVSADVLLGKIDYCDVQKFYPIKPFGTTLRHILQETNITQYRVIKDLNISQASMYFWLLNNRLPTVENIDRLADYLDVRVDYLLGRIS